MALVGTRDEGVWDLGASSGTAQLGSPVLA